MKCFSIFLTGKNEQGAVAIMVGLCLFVLVGFSAFAIDIPNLCVAKNELQNAADAGALAGAQDLYNNAGTAVNVNANQIARDAAVANRSQGTPAEVNWSGGNTGDVQRGHWSFTTRTFTPNGSLAPVDLWNRSTAELDLDSNFINAIRVIARRQNTPVQSFFARIFGINSFPRAAEAVAYIGFAGTLRPQDADQPIAICADSLRNENGQYTCNVGRMINSGQNLATGETGGWTSLSQDDPCTGGTNAQEVRSLTCSNGNEETLTLGNPIATNGGEIQTAFSRLEECWMNETGGLTPWELTLPVITCPGSNVSTCEDLVGAVTLQIIWITGSGEDPGYNNVPTQMTGVPGYVDWDGSTIIDGAARWTDFATYYNLLNADGTLAPYMKKCIYFLPDCNPHIPSGISGGENFGVLAKIPVLVQ